MKEITFSITTGTIIRIMLFLGGAVLLWYLRELALIVLTSIIIASAIEPAARALTKYKIPRVLAVLGVYSLFFGAFFSIVFFLLPPILNETSNMLGTLPSYLETIGANGPLTESTISQTRSVINGFTFGESTQNLTSLLSGLSGNFLSVMSVIFGGLLSFILVVVFSFYFAVNERAIEAFLRVLTPLKYEEHVLDLWKRTQHKIGLWMQGQFLLAILIGVLSYLGLLILGIPYALVLAVIAGVMELIPVFGPILSAIPAIAIAFSTGGIGVAIEVGVFYLIIQQFENHLIYPLVVTKVVGVPPILVILALLIGAKLAGVLGIFLSVPIAAAFQELFKDIEKARHSPKKQNG